ncbi:MAG: PAS domain-containing protein [Euryarchaeota archaeon]|nr:PAS domain-containing protein [Euryarchaeota archaeon]
MIENLSYDILEAIFDVMPVEISFIDSEDTVRYYSKGDNRIFKRTPSVIGLKVQNCHPKESLDKVTQVLNNLREGKKDSEEFWIDLNDRKIYIRYFAVRDKNGKYLGTLEASQDITDIQKMKGEKRLLD